MNFLKGLGVWLLTCTGFLLYWLPGIHWYTALGYLMILPSCIIINRYFSTSPANRS
jgi:hypothetical protein